MQFSVGGTGTIGSYLDIKLPIGFSWEGVAYGPIVTGGSGSNTMTYVGLVGGRHRITFGSSTQNQIIKLGFWQKATCGAGTSSFTTRDSLFFYEGAGSINVSVTNAFNGEAPDFSIIGDTTFPNPININQTATRKFTLTNGGLGASSKIVLVDNYTNNSISINTSSFIINPSGINYNIPVSQIVNNNDSVIINLLATHIQQIGDGDTLFENGESFEIQYTFTINTCGVSNNINSNIYAYWGCNSAICQRSTVTVDIQIPNTVPSLNQLFLAEKNSNCWNDNDTFLVRIVNTSINRASNVNYIAVDATPFSGLDTNNVSFKIGINGVWKKPQISNYVNKIMHTGINLASSLGYFMGNLNGGDTIYLNFTTRKVCPTDGTIAPSLSAARMPKPSDLPSFPNCGSNVQMQWSSPSIRITYSNACGTVNYQSSSFPLQLLPYAPRLLRNGIQINGPTDVNYGDTVIINLQRAPGASIERRLPTNAKYTHLRKITLPSNLVYTGVYPLAFGIGNVDTLFYNTSTNEVYLKFSTFSNPVYNLPITPLCGNSGLVTIYDRLYILNNSNCSTCDTIVMGNCNWIIGVHCPSSGSCEKGGFTPNGLIFQRITYGLGDNDNNNIPNGPIDLTKINRSSFVAGDTFEIIISGKTFRGSQSPASPFINGYASLNFDNGIGQYLQVLGVDGFLNDTNNSGSSNSYNLTNLPYQIITKSGGNRTVRVDFSVNNLVSSGVPSTYEFDNNDSVFLKIKATWNSLYNGNTRTSLIITDTIFISHIQNPNNDTAKYQCDNYRARILLDGQIFTGSSSPTSDVMGCNGVIIQSTLLSYNPDNANSSSAFPYESRFYTLPDTFIFILPAGYELGKTWSYTPFVDTLTYTRVSGNTYYFPLRQLFTQYGGLRNLNAEGYIYSIYTNVYPTCNSSNTLPRYYNFPTQGYGSFRILNLRPWVVQYGNPNTIIVGETGGNINYSVNKPILDISVVGSVTKPLYEKVATWDFNVQNNSNIASSPLTWVYFDTNTTIQVDSVRDLSSNNLITSVNNYYRLGNLNTGGANKNFRIYGRVSSCNKDTLKAFVGWNCRTYPNILPIPCQTDSVLFVIDTASASIQTAITSLASTPSDPSNSASSPYGSSTITMCQGFPFEMLIQSTQASNIYDVKEIISLPFNGGSGLDYISDSGYIEYPIGTTPRLFSATANAAILAEVTTGTMTLDLAQIDPSNFGTTSGLLGTALGNNNTRRAILRWKMKSNCNLVSGDQWTAQQEASSPCGNPAIGNSNLTSGFPISLAGITNPYVATINVSTGLDGCGAQVTQIRIEKTGATAPQPTDSITIRLPKLVSAGALTCYGIACPGGSGSSQSYIIRTDATYQYLTFQYPNTAGANGDTLLYNFPMTTINKAICENNQTVKADVFQQLTIYCGTPIPTNLCPNAKASLGSETKLFDIRKANLSFDAYSSTYVYPSLYKYVFSGNVLNTSAYVEADNGVTLKTFMDINNNLTYEKGIDSLVKTTVLTTSIPTNGSVAFSDSFENNLYPPSPSLPMYTVIDTGDATVNCFCGGVVMSPFNQALPIEFLSIKANNLNNLTGKVVWLTNTDIATSKFNVYRKLANEIQFVKIGEVYNKGINGVNEFVYYNPISNLAEGLIYYQIEAVSNNGIGKKSKITSILKTNVLSANLVFTLLPNPATNMVKVNLNEGLSDGIVKIMDMNGKEVLMQNFEGLVATLNTSQLAAGIYSVQVTSQEGIVETKKLSILR